MMKRVSIILMLSAVVAVSLVASAQSGAAGAIPRMPDGHPDLSGVWWRGLPRFAGQRRCAG